LGVEGRVQSDARGDGRGKFRDQANKSGRVVALKHIFTLELKEDPSLLSDLKEDVRVECVILGDATNVVLYDVSEPPVFRTPVNRSPFRCFVRSCNKGIMAVRFRDPTSAKVCVTVSPPSHRCTPTFFSPTHTPNLQKMQVRRPSSGSPFATSEQRFKGSKGEDDGVLGDGLDSERKRLGDFDHWLMDEGEACVRA
jgi:hypothetical protein